MEHYRLLLEDEEALDLLAHAASLLANADASADVLRALALSRLTALSKPGRRPRDRDRRHAPPLGVAHVGAPICGNLRPRHATLPVRASGLGGDGLLGGDAARSERAGR